jgi:hypothetical protein
MTEVLPRSRALWNRTGLDLRSDEVLAQILDRGDLADWRELFAIAKTDPQLRRRIVAVIGRVPLPLPRLWLAALARIGETVDIGMPLPRYDDVGT